MSSSPALHTLRRDKLQKLCKTHAIKANGKTSDLIDRLRQHAHTLPNDHPLSIAARTEPDEGPWEIVMESIQEVEETASGEFGTTGSKASTLIKSFANSIGLTRNKDELAQKSIPYDAVRPATPPLNDNFTFDPTTVPYTQGDPLPGCTLRPGIQAPDNARLSLGLDEAMPLPHATTTLRLVSSSSNDTLLVPGDKPNEVFLTPKLKPVETTFDLVMTPGGPSASGAVSNFWAPDARPEGIQSMYPKLTIDDLPPDLPPSSMTTNTLSVPTDPFIFGSPLPEHSISNSQFKTAATNVLEEMNQRLRSSGVEGVGMDIVEKLKPGAHTQEDLERERRVVPMVDGERRRKGEITKKFDDVHRAEFEKMEGIDGVVRKGVAPLVIGKKRKSDVLGDRRPGGTTSNGRRGKKARMDYDRDDAMNVDTKDHEREKEREVIKRKLDMSRAKRRSSGGGTTTRKISVARKDKPKLGFLASAKKFVTSMWGKKPVAQPDSSVVRKLSLGKKGFAPTTKSGGSSSHGRLGEQGQVKAKSKSVGGRVGNNEGNNGKVNSVGVGSRIARPTTGTTVSSMGTTRPRAMTVNDAVRVRVNSNASSRLLAPTASSLAKVKRGNQQPLSLGTITNCTTTEKKKGPVTRVKAKSPSSGLPLWSPRSSNNDTTAGKIFRKPLTVTGVTGIPVPVSKKGGGDEEKMDVDGDGDGGEMKVLGVVRQRTLTRKPRISRSKVIAKLASQRAAASSSSTSSSSMNSRVVSGPSSRPEVIGTPVLRGFRPVSSGRRVRSSLGEAKRGRATIAGGAVVSGGMALTPGGKGGRGERERSVVVSARKRFRQSEIARRRSRVSCGE